MESIHQNIDIKLYNEDDQYRNGQLKSLFNSSKLRSIVQKVIFQLGGNHHDAEDMFQEGIIVLDRNIRNGKYRHEGSLESYFISTCKLLWMNASRKKSRVDYSEDISEVNIEKANSPEDQFLEEEVKELLAESLSQLDERSQKILKLWQLSYSMKEIAHELGISSEGMARKLKFQSLKKLTAIIKKSREWQEGAGEEKDHLFIRAKNETTKPFTIRRVENHVEKSL